jgi:hypothetical protein
MDLANSVKSSGADSGVRWFEYSNAPASDSVSVIRVVIWYYNPDDGNDVGPWNVTLLQPLDVAVSPGGFYWICSQWKLQDISILESACRIRVTLHVRLCCCNYVWYTFRSVVGISTGSGLGGRGIVYRWWLDFSYHPEGHRGPPSFLYIGYGPSPGINQREGTAGHPSSSSAGLGMGGAIPPLPHCACPGMGWGYPSSTVGTTR